MKKSVLSCVAVCMTLLLLAAAPAASSSPPTFLVVCAESSGLESIHIVGAQGVGQAIRDCHARGGRVAAVDRL